MRYEVFFFSSIYGWLTVGSHSPHEAFQLMTWLRKQNYKTSIRKLH